MQVEMEVASPVLTVTCPRARLFPPCFQKQKQKGSSNMTGLNLEHVFEVGLTMLHLMSGWLYKGDK